MGANNVEQVVNGQGDIRLGQEPHDVRRRPTGTRTEKDHADGDFRRHFKSQDQGIRQQRHNRIMSRTADEDFLRPLDNQLEIPGVERHAHTEHDDA